MLRNVTLAAGLLIALAVPAYADCAGDIEKAEQALATASLSDDDKAAAMESITAAKDKMSDEAACQEELADAKDILGLE